MIFRFFEICSHISFLISINTQILVNKLDDKNHNLADFKLKFIEKMNSIVDKTSIDLFNIYPLHTWN